jgi:heme exporter protein CcmD
MDFTAAHWGYVATSYALSFLFILGLTVRVVLKDRKLRDEAQRLDRQRRKGEP